MSISKVIAHQDKLKSKIAYADRMENCSLKSVMAAEEIVHYAKQKDNFMCTMENGAKAMCTL